MLDKVSETSNVHITRQVAASKLQYLELLDTYCVVPRYKILYTRYTRCTRYLPIGTLP